MARSIVSGSFVRDYLKSDAGQAALAADDVSTEVGARGKFSDAQIAVFHKKNRGKSYTPGVKPERTVTVKVTTFDKKGRKRSKKVTKTVAEARAITGTTGKVGRVPLEALAEALSDKAPAPSEA